MLANLPPLPGSHSQTLGGVYSDSVMAFGPVEVQAVEYTQQTVRSPTRRQRAAVPSRATESFQSLHRIVHPGPVQTLSVSHAGEAGLGADAAVGESVAIVDGVAEMAVRRADRVERLGARAVRVCIPGQRNLRRRGMRALRVAEQFGRELLDARPGEPVEQLQVQRRGAAGDAGFRVNLGKRCVHRGDVAAVTVEKHEAAEAVVGE